MASLGRRLAWLNLLDAFDFTIFPPIMLPISQEFHVPRRRRPRFSPSPCGCGWSAPLPRAGSPTRIGRKKPLMISIAWYSACNFIAAFSPTFWFGLIGRYSALAWRRNGRAARHWRWKAGQSARAGSWPESSIPRWGLGALCLSSAADGSLDSVIGWCGGLLMLGVLPALAIVYVRKFVQEPPVWVENRRLQRTQHREVRVPLLKIFKRGLLANTLTGCWWMASAFVVGYSVGGLFPTYLQKDLHLSPGLVALPVMLQSIVFFLSGSFYGWLADRIGRRWAIIIPALLTIPIAPLYLFTHDYAMIVVFFTVQGAFGGGGMHTLYPAYLAERFPTEVRATATGFVYHQGAIFGGLTLPIITYFAVTWHSGFALPMMIGTSLAALSVAAAVFAGPETRGKQLVAELSVA